MFIEPTITRVFSGVLWVHLTWHKNCVEKKLFQHHFMKHCLCSSALGALWFDLCFGSCSQFWFGHRIEPPCYSTTVFLPQFQLVNALYFMDWKSIKDPWLHGDISNYDVRLFCGSVSLVDFFQALVSVQLLLPRCTAPVLVCLLKTLTKFVSVGQVADFSFLFKHWICVMCVFIQLNLTIMNSDKNVIEIL